MKKIISRLYAIKADKFLHFIGGMIIAQVVCVLLAHACNGWMSFVGAFLLGTLIVAAKEISDIKFGVPSWKDFIASVVGVVVGLLILMI